MTGRTARGPQVAIGRVVEWPDTDAAGHYHHSSALRWAEAAEAELLDQLGLVHLLGVVPRVRYEIDYQARLWFRDRVLVYLRVACVGSASIRYAFEVRRGDELAASGSMTAVHIDPQLGRSVPWPDDVRARLAAPDLEDLVL